MMSLKNVARAFIFVATAALASPAAQALPITDPSTWSGSGPGTQTITAIPGGIQFDYHVGSFFCAGCGTNYWAFQTIAPETGTLSFNYTYNLFSAWFQASSGLYVRINGGPVAILDPFNPNDGSASGSGSLSLSLVAGDFLDFIVQEYNFDSAPDIGGTITLTQLSGATGEASVPAPGALALLGLGLLGLGGLRRKKAA